MVCLHFSFNIIEIYLGSSCVVASVLVNLLGDQCKCTIYSGEFFPDIKLLTQCYYYHRGTRLYAMKTLNAPKRFENFPSSSIRIKFRCIQIFSS